jgi:ketosteroid isomerase-like protein
MSEENVQLVRKGYEAWNRQDLEGALEMLAPGFEFRPLPGYFDLKDIYQGREGFTSFWETWLDAWKTMKIKIERLEGRDDRVLAWIRFEGIGRTSDVPVSLDVGHLWTVRGGQVISLTAMPADALDVSRLEE